MPGKKMSFRTRWPDTTTKQAVCSKAPGQRPRKRGCRSSHNYQWLINSLSHHDLRLLIGPILNPWPQNGVCVLAQGWRVCMTTVSSLCLVYFTPHSTIPPPICKYENKHMLLCIPIKNKRQKRQVCLCNLLTESRPRSSYRNCWHCCDMPRSADAAPPGCL